jgi:hypothetical protein
MKNLVLLTLAALAAACSPRWLERSALRDERRAAELAQRRDGLGAAELHHPAENKRATAQERARHHGRFWAELTFN